MEQANAVVEFGRAITEPPSRVALARTVICELSDHQVNQIFSIPELRPGDNVADWSWGCLECLEELGLDIGSAMRGYAAGASIGVTFDFEADARRRKTVKDIAREKYFKEHPDKDTRLKKKNGDG